MKYGVFVGLSTLDLVYRVDGLPGLNEKIVARSQDAFVGGPATNAAVTFSHLGGKSTLVTVAGHHPLTQVLREDLDRYSVRLVDLNMAFEDLPPISSIMVTPSGERTVVSANATRVSQNGGVIEPMVLDRASVLLVDGHFMEASVTSAKIAKSAGVPVVFDGGSWKPRTMELLDLVDIAICSANFIPPGAATAEEVFDFLERVGVHTIAITNGANPILYFCGDQHGSLSVPKIIPVDTMGAGDIFHGAFCFYFAEGCDFTDALTKAAQVASASCTYRGTRVWMAHGPVGSGA